MPGDDNTLTITPNLHLPRSELQFRFARSGGPGGQHVNKTESKVELLFDVARSPSLSDAQRTRTQERLAGYIDQEGILYLVSDASRSQHQNRQEVIARLVMLLRHALRVQKPRRPTQPTAAARERRLRQKRRRSDLKRARRAPAPEE